MSTRSTISVKDEDDVFYIYRHSDGYPRGRHGVVAGILKAFEYAWPLPRFKAMDFAAALVSAWKQPGGGGIYFTTSHESHADTEFQYYIWFQDDQLMLKIMRPGNKRAFFKGTFEQALSRFEKED